MLFGGQERFAVPVERSVSVHSRERRLDGSGEDAMLLKNQPMKVSKATIGDPEDCRSIAENAERSRSGRLVRSRHAGRRADKSQNSDADSVAIPGHLRANGISGAGIGVCRNKLCLNAAGRFGDAGQRNLEIGVALDRRLSCCGGMEKNECDQQAADFRFNLRTSSAGSVRWQFCTPPCLLSPRRGSMFGRSR